MDVVYTWVDGETPGYAELLSQYARRKLDLNPNRFRDNLDILKYSLRSLERHAPWIHKLYLVTARPQVPRWLDPEAPGLTLLHHEEIFDPEHLPTFNSFAIVCNLYKIPGVSRRFLYMEDDRLLGRRIEPSDFFTPDERIKVYPKLGATDAGELHDSDDLSPWEAALAHSNHLLDQRYGRSRRGSLHHAPLVIDTASFARFAAEWKREIELTTSSRFRSKHNIAPEHMYPHHLLHESQAVSVPTLQVYRDSSYLGLDNLWPLTCIGLRHLRLRRPKFVCLNDNFGERPHPVSVRLTERFLEASYPEPSRFERR